jgi:hypothetical protein
MVWSVIRAIEADLGLFGRVVTSHKRLPMRYECATMRPRLQPLCFSLILP